MLRLDHIFVCCSEGAPEAQALLDAGLVEGTPNTHPGQGTANRRFFFENGFLELLWVHDENEARSALTAPTRLWERWAGRRDDTSPFGLCFSSPDGVESLPFGTRTYAPEYLPEGRSILFAESMPLTEPEVLVLSWPVTDLARGPQVTTHALGLRTIRSVSVGLPQPTAISTPLRALINAGLVKTHQSSDAELVIAFDSRQDVRITISDLSVTLIGSAEPGN